MKKMLVFLITWIGLASCADEGSVSQNQQQYDTPIEAPPLVPAPVPAVETPKTLSVYNAAGENVSLDIGSENTIYCVMATWCPHSQQLIDNINNAKYSSVFKKQDFVFLYSRNELKHLIRDIASHMTRASEEEIQAKREELTTLSESEFLYDSDVLSQIPNRIKVYYYDSEMDNLVHGFPNSYTSSTRSFSESPYQLVVNKNNETYSLIESMDK